MELRSNINQKKTIDCTMISHTVLDKSEWSFNELHHTDVDLDNFDENSAYSDVLSWCIQTLSFSFSARAMLKEAADKHWKVSLEDLSGGEYCIDIDQKHLILDNNALLPSALGRSSYFRNSTLISMVKALRDIWQEKRHGGFDELYAPEHIMLMERARAADLDVISILVAWELRSEAYSEAWRHLIGSEIGDMAMAFSGYLERDPSSQFNGQALAAVFRQWFLNAARVDSCDRNALEYMDEVLFNSDTTHPFGHKKPTKMNIEILSCLPDKTAYLQGQGAEILTAPIYASVNNEINQTYLLHIMHDMEAIIVEDVPFRDANLAMKIFPDNF